MYRGAEPFRGCMPVSLPPQVLVDTPLAPYFSDNLTSEDLDEMNIEVRPGCLPYSWRFPRPRTK